MTQPRKPLLHRTKAFSVLLLATYLAGAPLAASGQSSSADEDFFPDWATTAKYNLPLSVRDTDSALGRRNLRLKILTLRDVALVHGHLCDGLVVAWVELGAALRTLFPDGVVDRTDLRAVSKNGPCWVDAVAWTTGARINHGTLVLDNDAVGDGFLVQRLSTGVAVRVSVKAGVSPQDLVELERSIRGRLTSRKPVGPEEIDRFEALASSYSRRLLETAPELVVQVEELKDFTFPTTSRNLLAPRSDIINRDLPRRTGAAGKGMEHTMTASTTHHASAAFQAAETFAEAIRTMPECEEWDSARAAARTDPGLQRLLAARRDLLNQTYRASRDPLARPFAAEEERIRTQIVQHPASLRQQAAVTALVQLLRTLNVALSGSLGVDFAQLASPPRGGGCCG